MKNFRFRSGLFGRLVLQRANEWNEGGQIVIAWHDATPGDLAAYYQQLYSLMNPGDKFDTTAVP